MRTTGDGRFVRVRCGIRTSLQGAIHNTPSAGADVFLIADPSVSFDSLRRDVQALPLLCTQKRLLRKAVHDSTSFARGRLFYCRARQSSWLTAHGYSQKIKTTPCHDVLLENCFRDGRVMLVCRSHPEGYSTAPEALASTGEAGRY